MMKKYQLYIDKMTDTFMNIPSDNRIKFVQRLIQLCNRSHEQYVIAMLYIYGMRPAELMLIKKGHFLITDEHVRLRLPTVKEGEKRTIKLRIEDTPFLDLVVKHVKSTENLIPLSWHCTTNINAIFKKIAKRRGKKRLSPYIFRKYRLSYLAVELDATAAELQAWKGAKDMRSVSPYIRMKPITRFESKIK